MAGRREKEEVWVGGTGFGHLLGMELPAFSRRAPWGRAHAQGMISPAPHAPSILGCLTTPHVLPEAWEVEEELILCIYIYIYTVHVYTGLYPLPAGTSGIATLHGRNGSAGRHGPEPGHVPCLGMLPKVFLVKWRSRGAVVRAEGSLAGDAEMLLRTVLPPLGAGLQPGDGSVPWCAFMTGLLPLVLVHRSARLLLQGLPGHWRPCNAFCPLW